jgi:pimeloyl-[acyl-carrier protein] synthase
MTNQSVIFNPRPLESPVAEPASAPPSVPPNPLQNPALLANPYGFYALLRQSNPVFRVPIPAESGAGIWLLTRHADVELALRDRRFLADRTRSDVARLFADRVPQALSGGPGGVRTLLVMDPPEHTRARGLVSKAFTPRRIAALAPRIEALVEELLDAALAGGGGFDVIHDLAEPLPAIVIAELLGVPPEDHRAFKQWSSALIETIPKAPFVGARAVDEKAEVILDYLRRVIAERRREPRDDLISALVEAQEEGGALADGELLSLSFLLLLAGHETTTNLIGNGTLALLRNPDQLERLRAGPGLVENAVEELLRYDSPVQATARVAAEDVEIGGQPVPQGALLVCGIGAANRDPAAHAEPDRLDVGRTEIRHLSFGLGAHFCLGAALARLEGQQVFRALVQRAPGLRLATEAPAYRPNLVLRGLSSLPVTVRG